MTVAERARVEGKDHSLYTWAAAVALVVVFAGFSRTFFLKGAFGSPALSALPIIHGVIMTLWFGLFLLQSRLIAMRKQDLHRRLGIFGAILAVAVVIAGVSLGISAARQGHSPGPPPLIFLGVPLFDMLIFGILASTGIYFRARAATHKRLMLLANLAMLTAAIARIPIALIHDAGLPMYFGLTILIILLFVAIDSIRHRRLHPAFAWGAALVIASVPIRLWVMGTAAWMSFATWVVR